VATGERRYVVDLSATATVTLDRRDDLLLTVDLRSPLRGREPGPPIRSTCGCGAWRP
jgi:hypothetical protein